MENFFKDKIVVEKSKVEGDVSSAQEGREGSHAPFQNFSEDNPTQAKEENAEETVDAVFDDEATGYRVELVKENSIINRIIVSCPCGKQITLQCQYQEVEADT